MGYRVNYAGIDLHESFKVLNVNINTLNSRENYFKTIPSMNGQYYMGYRYNPKEIEIEIGFSKNSKKDYFSKLDELAYIMDVKNPSKLLIEGNHDKYYYYALPGDQIDIEKVRYTGKCKLKFVCNNPFAYALNRKAFSLKDSKLTIENLGTTGTYMNAGFEFKNPATFLRLTNPQGRTVLIGGVKDIEKPDISNGNKIVDDYCELASNFTESGNVLDASNRVVDGSFGVGRDGTAIIPIEYGQAQKNKWVGTCFRRSLHANVEEFEVRINLTFSSQGKNFIPPSNGEAVKCMHKSGLAIRSNASQSGKVLGHLPYEEIVKIITTTTNNSEKITYGKIVYGKVTGYCNANFLWRININSKSSRNVSQSYAMDQRGYAENQMGLIECHGFSQNGVRLFKFLIKDTSQYFEYVEPQIYLNGKVVLSDGNRLPSPNTVNQKDEDGKPSGVANVESGVFGIYNDFTGTFKLRRKRLENGKFRWWGSISKTLEGISVADEMHMGAGLVDDSLPEEQLNHLVFYMARFDEYQQTDVMSINHVTVLDISNELNKESKTKVREATDGNKIIFENGDNLQIDFEQGEICKNGESFMKYLDIGSDFFEVDAGISEISVISDDEELEGSATIQERYN